MLFSSLFAQIPFIIWLCMHLVHFSSPGLSSLCCKELQPVLNMPFFHLSLKKRMRTPAPPPPPPPSLGRSAEWAALQFLFRPRATTAQISTKFPLISAWNNIILRGLTLGSRGWCITCYYMFVPKRAILALPGLPESKQWWDGEMGGVPDDQRLVITHQHQAFAEALLCCVSFPHCADIIEKQLKGDKICLGLWF